jgi:glycerophosphoryl diester phosphodiesterase
VHPYFDLPRPHLFAHRGASGERPQNTIPAFERAIELGIPYLETDCQATWDGEIVLSHDETVDDQTDGSGPIRDYEFADLQRLDAGHGFTPDGGETFPFRGQGVRIPRLAEVLERFPQARINLEIKEGERNQVEEVVRIVRAARATERVLLAASEDVVMEAIRKLDPGTAIGSSTGDVVAFFEALAEDRWREHQPNGHALQIPPEFSGLSLITEDSIAAAHELGLLIHVWTVNRREQMQDLLDAGVDGIMTDYPALLLDVVAARG